MTKNGIKESWQKSTWIKQKKPLEKQETADAGILGKVLEEFSRSSRICGGNGQAHISVGALLQMDLSRGKKLGKRWGRSKTCGGWVDEG